MTYTCEIYKIRLLKCAKDNSFVLEEKAPHFTTWAKVTQNSIKSNNVTFTNTGYCITISCHIESWEFSEVGALEALLIPVHTPHDSRPGLPENLRHKPSVYNKNKLVKKKKTSGKTAGISEPPLDLIKCLNRLGTPFDVFFSNNLQNLSKPI